MIGGDAFWYPHTVSVRDITAGGMGSSYGSARSLAAEVLDEQRLVRAADGAEVVSSTRVTVAVDAAVAPGSLVTVWAGTAAEREATVLAVQQDVNDLPLPSHLVLFLT